MQTLDFWLTVTNAFVYGIIAGAVIVLLLASYKIIKHTHDEN